MATFADKASFEVRWLPFQLNPQAPQEGKPKLQYYNEKFGAARVAQMLPYMTGVFAKEGLPYSMGGLTGSTMNSHRIIELAGQQGLDKQNVVVEELFKAYFCEEKYVNDPEVLLQAARIAGVEGAEAVLSNLNAMVAEVNAKMQRGRGVGGVPFFIIDNKIKLSGAQESEVFEEAFQDLLSH